MALRIIDEKSGKPISGVNILVIPKSKCKEKDWLMLYQHPLLLQLIKNKEITGMDFRVLLLLVYLSEYNNVVNVTQKYLASELQVRESQISRSISKLEEFHCLSKAILQGQTVFFLSKSLVKKGRKPSKRIAVNNAKKSSKAKNFPKKDFKPDGYSPAFRYEEK